VSELAQLLGLLLIILSATAVVAFVAARRGGDRGAAQLAAAVLISIFLGLTGLVVAMAFSGPSD
jgi:hypothetical protein